MYLHLLVELEPEYAEQFRFLEDHLNFIKNLRDLYRLKVAAHNVISRETLPPVAVSMGYGEDDLAADRLYEDYLERTELASGVIDRLVDLVKA